MIISQGKEKCPKPQKCDLINFLVSIRPTVLATCKLSRGFIKIEAFIISKIDK